MANIPAAALVHFTGSRYGAGGTMDVSRQARELRYVILFYFKEQTESDALRGDYGAYQTFETVRHALQNVIIEGATPIAFVSETLTHEEAGRWEWAVEVSLSIPAVAARLVQTPKPLIRKEQP